MKKNLKETTPFCQTEEAAEIARILPLLRKNLAFIETEMEELYKIRKLADSIYYSDKLKIEAWEKEYASPAQGKDFAKGSAVYPEDHLSQPPEPPIVTIKSIAKQIKKYIINRYKGLHHRISKGMGKHE